MERSNHASGPGNQLDHPRAPATRPRRYHTGLIAVTILLVCLLSFTPVTQALRKSSNNGVKAAKELGIYPTATSRKALTRINWGIVHPGDVCTQTIYIQNREREPLTLRLQTGNWQPLDAQAAFSVQWDLGPEHVLPPRTTIPVTLSLIAPASAQNIVEFQFDIIILADLAS